LNKKLIYHPLPMKGTLCCPKCGGGGCQRHEEGGKPSLGRCPLCWGTGVIPAIQTYQSGDLEFALGYWDCECLTDTIHPENHDRCTICGAIQEDQPPSRAGEVREYLASFGVVVTKAQEADSCSRCHLVEALHEVTDRYERLERLYFEATGQQPDCSNGSITRAYKALELPPSSHGGLPARAGQNTEDGHLEAQFEERICGYED
jgi:hypothetical protein